MKKTAFFTFGKFSPPTLGHAHMIEEMIKIAKGADVYIVASESVRPANAPVNVNQKLEILRRMFSNKNVKITSAKSPLIFLKTIENKYNKVNMIVGQDRQTAFNWMKKHTPIYRKSISIPRPKGAISATAVRTAARNGKINEMKSMLHNLPESMINKLYKTIRTAKPPPK